MERIPQPVFLPGTPKVIIKKITVGISSFNRWVMSPGNRESELTKMKQLIENDIVLATNIDISPVWNKLQALNISSTEKEFDESLLEFHTAIKLALLGPNAWGELTPTKRSAKYNNIIISMRELAEDLQNYDLDQHDLVSYPGNHGNSCLICYDGNKEDEVTSFRDAYVNQTGIQISELLQKHALKLEKQNRYRSPLTTQTKGTRELSHFIRSLASYNTTKYSKPLGGVISRLASAYFPNLEVDPNKVRRSIRGLFL